MLKSRHAYMTSSRCGVENASISFYTGLHPWVLDSGFHRLMRTSGEHPSLEVFLLGFAVGVIVSPLPIGIRRDNTHTLNI